MSNELNEDKGVLEKIEESLEHMVGGQGSKQPDNYTHVPGHPRMGAGA